MSRKYLHAVYIGESALKTAIENENLKEIILKALNENLEVNAKELCKQFNGSSKKNIIPTQIYDQKDLDTRENLLNFYWSVEFDEEDIRKAIEANEVENLIQAVVEHYIDSGIQLLVSEYKLQEELREWSKLCQE